MAGRLEQRKRRMIDEVARWSGTTSATLTICASLTAFTAFAVSGWCSWRVGRDGRPSATGLTHSGWRMQSRQVLEHWEEADRKDSGVTVRVVRSALWSYWTDLFASLTLGFTLFVAAATVGAEEGVMRIHQLRDPAAFAAIGATLAAVLVDVAMLLVVRQYRSKGSVNWLFISVAMAGAPARVLLGAAAILYIFVAAAAT
jgi:hypothetical protein